MVVVNYFLFSFIFAIILFLYLHVEFHLRKSNDLEVYEIDTPSKSKLEEICDLRQPVLFRYDNPRMTELCTLAYIEEHYSAFDMNVRKSPFAVVEKPSSSKDDGKEGEDSERSVEKEEPTNKSENIPLQDIPLRVKDMTELFTKDANGAYISRNNASFLQETTLLKDIRYNDDFLRPPMVSKSEYDVMVASRGTTLPLQQSLSYRNFFYVIEGEVKVKLICPQYEKYLAPTRDYVSFEFYSPVNPWNVQQKYKGDFDKVRTLDLTLRRGDMLFVPAYWWYSFNAVSMSTIAAFHYRTYMNTIAILPELSMYMLQRSNMKEERVKKHAE